MSRISKYFSSALLSLLLTYSFTELQPTAYAQNCGCDVSDGKERTYSEMLKFDANERREAGSLHLTFGIQQNTANATNEYLLHQDEYIIMYEDDLRMPLWVGYQLRRCDLSLERGRTKCFRRDIRISNQAAAYSQARKDELV